MNRTKRRSTTLFLDVAAAYNRDDMPIPDHSGDGQEIISLLMSNPSYCRRMTDQETEDMLMELYIARRRRAQ